VAYVNLYNEKKRKHFEEKQQLKQAFNQTLLQSQLEIKEETLRHVSAEIHDNLGQLASLIKINLNTIEYDDKEKAQLKLEATRELMRNLITDLKSLSLSLNSDRVAHLGLCKSIETEVVRLNRTGLFIAEFVKPEEEPPIDPDQAVILFRMVQEVLNNCIKHSDAREIRIGMQVVEGKLMLSIRDNGKGFALSENTFSEGQGLLNLRTRAKLIHGTISISSTPGEGTSIIIEKSM